MPKLTHIRLTREEAGSLHHGFGQEWDPEDAIHQRLMDVLTTARRDAMFPSASITTADRDSAIRSVRQQADGLVRNHDLQAVVAFCAYDFEIDILCGAKAPKQYFLMRIPAYLAAKDPFITWKASDGAGGFPLGEARNLEHATKFTDKQLNDPELRRKLNIGGTFVPIPCEIALDRCERSFANEGGMAQSLIRASGSHLRIWQDLGKELSS